MKVYCDDENKVLRLVFHLITPACSGLASSALPTTAYRFSQATTIPIKSMPNVSNTICLYTSAEGMGWTA